MERRMPFFKTMPWGCSLTQIKWEAEDIPSAKLGYICYTYGFFFEAHRAEADCRALLEMLHYPLPVSGITGLKAILNEYQKEEVSLAAVNSPFHSKDALKARGYRWEGTEKFWHTSLSAELLDDETAWLRAIVHGGRPFQMGISKVSAFNRFSDRPIQREMIPG
jgi:DNA polymerase-3 subunit epsilon